jgi:hypothetical protein
MAWQLIHTGLQGLTSAPFMEQGADEHLQITGQSLPKESPRFPRARWVCAGHGLRCSRAKGLLPRLAPEQTGAGKGAQSPDHQQKHAFIRASALTNAQPIRQGPPRTPQRRPGGNHSPQARALTAERQGRARFHAASRPETRNR